MARARGGGRRAGALGGAAPGQGIPGGNLRAEALARSGRVGAAPTVESLAGRVDDGEIIAWAAPNHQIERAPLLDLGR